MESVLVCGEKNSNSADRNPRYRYCCYFSSYQSNTGNRPSLVLYVPSSLYCNWPIASKSALGPLTISVTIMVLPASISSRDQASPALWISRLSSWSISHCSIWPNGILSIAPQGISFIRPFKAAKNLTHSISVPSLRLKGSLYAAMSSTAGKVILSPFAKENEADFPVCASFALSTRCKPLNCSAAAEKLMFCSIVVKCLLLTSICLSLYIKKKSRE